MKAYQQIEQTDRDAYADIYEHWYLQNKGRLFDVRERDIFVRAVSRERPRAVLDLGCGTGRVASAIRPLVEHVVACDFSFKSLQLLDQKKRMGISPVCADAATGLPLHDASIDMIVSCQCLQYLQGSDLDGALQECFRVLRPGGSLVSNVYNLDYWRFRGVREIQNGDGTYVRRFAVGCVRRLAREHAFRLEQILYYKALPFRRLRHRSWLDVDGLLCDMPWLKKRLSVYLAICYRKPTAEERGEGPRLRHPSPRWPPEIEQEW